MNILELEEGIRNLIVTQPAILSGENGKIINSIKDIIEAHKAFLFRIEEYPENDILKVGAMNESSKLELNLTSYVCQILQERGINIMLYVPKYAAVYNNEISKYVDKIMEPVEEQKEDKEKNIVEEIKTQEVEDTKFLVVEKNEQQKSEKNNSENKIETQTQKEETKIQSESKGRDYLMELLKK